MQDRPAINIYPDPRSMALAVSVILSDQISAALSERDTVLFAAAGGGTPIEVYTHLSRLHLPWERVTVTLTDERCVPPDSPESNERMLRQSLLKNAAAEAAFVSPLDLASGRTTPAASSSHCVDVMLLGMGEDGHIASLFPGRASESTAKAHSAWIRVPAGPAGTPPPQPRVSLRFKSLLEARRVHLIATGQKKRTVIEAAFGADFSDEVPLHLFLRTRRQIDISWSP